MAMKYLKKSLAVEALQFNGLNYDAIADFCAPHIVTALGKFKLRVWMENENVASLEEGGWVVKREDGIPWCVSDRVFQREFVAMESQEWPCGLKDQEPELKPNSVGPEPCPFKDLFKIEVKITGG